MMKNLVLGKAGFFVSILMIPMVSEAAVVTVGPGGFDDGWATSITYEDNNAVARRGDVNDRDDPLNALGANDGDFFELGFGSTADFTFGTNFDTSVSVFEVTFGTASNWPEKVEVFAGISGGGFTSVGTITNSAAQGGGVLSLTGLGILNTIRLTDLSPLTSSGQSDSSGALGGFDIDAVRVSPVPLPAAAWLFGSALLGFFGLARRKKA